MRLALSYTWLPPEWFCIGQAEMWASAAVLWTTDDEHTKQITTIFVKNDEPKQESNPWPSAYEYQPKASNDHWVKPIDPGKLTRHGDVDQDAGLLGRCPLGQHIHERDIQAPLKPNTHLVNVHMKATHTGRCTPESSTHLVICTFGTNTRLVIAPMKPVHTSSLPLSWNTQSSHPWNQLVS